MQNYQTLNLVFIRVDKHCQNAVTVMLSQYVTVAAVGLIVVYRPHFEQY